MDAEDACLFDRLPSAMRDSFLQQAFKLLDQHHQCGVVPLVCRLWQQLVPSTCSSLQVKVMDRLACKGATSWLEKHNPPLESLELKIERSIYMPDEARKLLQVVYSKVSLRNLKIDAVFYKEKKEEESALCSLALSSLTNLTSLEVQTYDLGKTTLASLLLLTQLRCLSFDDEEFYKVKALLQRVSSSLLQLTTLELRVKTSITEPQDLLPLTALHNLEDLQLPYLGVEAKGIAMLNQLPITSIKVVVAGDGGVQDVCSWLQECGGKINTLHLVEGYYTPLPLPELELLMSHLRTWAPQLRSLSVDEMTLIRYSTGLASLTQLTRLAVYDLRFDDAALHRLSALTGLRELEMGLNEVTGAGGSFECLASGLQQLTRLDVLSLAPADDAAEEAFRPRVVDVLGGRLMLRPGVTAGDD
jgi:hypothetical protein